MTDLPWLVEGRKYLGEKEIKGKENNPKIVAWGKAAGIGWWNNDDDPWCAVFVGGMLAACGLPTTGSALARSYLNYGVQLDPKRPVVGAIVVFPRGNSKINGHVGFISKVGDKTVEVLNGNSSDMVRYTTFSRASIIGLSWPSSVPLPAGALKLGAAAPTSTILRSGASGAAVRAYQEDLNALGYGLKVDGFFGAATRRATSEFQKLRGLDVDGEAGPATFAALKAAIDARKADVKALPDDKVRKSTTVQAGGLAVVGGASTVSIALDAAKQLADVHDDAASHFDGTTFGVVIGGVIFAAGAFMIWQRLRDADKLPAWLGGRHLVDDVPEAAA